MTRLPIGFVHLNVHHMDLMARARMDDAKRRAARGARNVRLGVHRRPRRRRGLLMRILFRLVGRH